MSLLASHLAVFTDIIRTTLRTLPQIEPQFISLVCNAIRSDKGQGYDHALSELLLLLEQSAIAQVMSHTQLNPLHLSLKLWQFMREFTVCSPTHIFAT